MVDAVKDQTINHWNHKGRHKELIFLPKIPNTVVDQFNLEMSQYGPFVYRHCTVFARPAGQKQSIHVDGNSESGISNASLNIPIFGGKGTMMHWYGGDYSIQEKDVGTAIPVVKYFDLSWNSPAVKIDSLEIKESYFVRVNIPHSVDAPEDTDKATLCIRFRKNPLLEEFHKFIAASTD